MARRAIVSAFTAPGKASISLPKACLSGHADRVSSAFLESKPLGLVKISSCPAIVALLLPDVAPDEIGLSIFRIESNSVIQIGNCLVIVALGAP